VQIWFWMHARVQNRQCAGSEERSVQEPSGQAVKLGGQWQLPASQVSFEAHRLPHVPQLVSLDVVSAHVRAQHVWPVGQTWPHAPQLFGSASTPRQVP
jgi:hypothetical protein